MAIAYQIRYGTERSVLDPFDERVRHVRYQEDSKDKLQKSLKFEGSVGLVVSANEVADELFSGFGMAFVFHIREFKFGSV